MRLALLLLFLLSCGGKLEGGATSDAGANTDGGDDPLGGGGKMLKGPCVFSSAFQPNDMDWIQLTRNNSGISTAARIGSASAFTLVCSGKGSDGFYYAITLTPVSVAVGKQMPMGDMYQSANGREAERAVGPCTTDVTSLGTNADGKQTVTGTFDCPYLFDDPIGHFHLEGSYTVPLP